MPYLLYASLAANAVAILALLYVAAKLATARQERDDANEKAADYKSGHAMLSKTTGELRAELAVYREREARQLAPLRAANDARKAKSANGSATA